MGSPVWKLGEQFLCKGINGITILLQKSQVPMLENGPKGRRYYEIKKKEANRLSADKVQPTGVI